MWIYFLRCLYELVEASFFGRKDFQWRDRNLSGFIKNIFICVSKMNKSLSGLEQGWRASYK